MATSEQRHENLVQHLLLTDNARGDFGAQTRRCFE
jgi:hypothetical protein